MPEDHLLSGPPPRWVWDPLITPEIVHKYFLCPLRRIELKVGGEISYGAGDKTLISGCILELMPTKRLVHSFAFRGEHPAASSKTSEQSIVVYNLRHSNGATILEFLHKGLPDDQQEYQRICEGWDLILSGLKTLLETGKPLPF